MREISIQLRALRDAAREPFARLDRDAENASPPVELLLGEIRQHAFEEKWRVSESRAAAGKPAARFRTELGRTPARYLAGVRIETASRLLRETDLKIGAISLLVGYSDVAPFRRAFKRWFGLPPSEFRRRARSAAVRSGGFEKELLDFRFWDRLERGALEPSRARRLARWLQAANRVEIGFRL